MMSPLLMWKLEVNNGVILESTFQGLVSHLPNGHSAMRVDQLTEELLLSSLLTAYFSYSTKCIVVLTGDV